MLLFLVALLAQAGGLSEERARQILPRADLHALTDQQRAQFLEIAGDTFGYAGCTETLARCLSAGSSDAHALRMAELVKALILEGWPTGSVIDAVERYYAGFAKEKRHKLDDHDCAQQGSPEAPVAVVEFSDYQCPHCAAAVKPLREMVDALPAKVRLCSKHFPLPNHPRAHIAAACAEFARSRGKFQQMSELIFANYEELGDAELKSFARKLGLDADAMLKQAYAGRYDAVIARHMKEAEAAGLHATPTLYFNGRQYTLPVKYPFLVFSAQDEDEWQRNKGAWAKD